MIVQPVWLRVYVVGFQIVWCGFIVHTVVLNTGRITPVIAGILFMMIGLAFSYRLIRMSVSSTEDGGLLVRNAFSTRQLGRTDIGDFRLDRTARDLPFGPRAVYALVRDGTLLRIDITRSGLGQRRSERQLATLRNWLAGG